MQDYNKGVLTPLVIRQVIEASKANDVPTGVDPKLNNFWEYKGATLYKPNLRELEAALGKMLKTDAEVEETGRQILHRLELEHLLVTRGAKGMVLFQDDEVIHIPAHAHRVHDVSGAGDTVIATIMTALAGGATIYEAATLANYAASVVIAEVGAVPIDPDKLRRACVER
mgnify:CR=1 FL=1